MDGSRVYDFEVKLTHSIPKETGLSSLPRHDVAHKLALYQLPYSLNPSDVVVFHKNG